MDAPQEKVAEFTELSSPAQRLPAVYALVEKHYERGEAVCIVAADPDTADELDSFLWTYRQNSFIPHVRLELAREPVIEPVLIVGAEPGNVTADVLIILSGPGGPECMECCKHLYDFAPTYDESLRLEARERFAACKNAGYRMRFRRSRGT
jgi:DNA polymerase-3 subunit chi